MADTGTVQRDYQRIPLTPAIRRLLLRYHFIDTSGNVISRRGRQRSPKRNIELERSHRPRTAAVTRYGRGHTRNVDIPPRPSSPEPPLNRRRPLTASVGRIRPTRTNATIERLPPRETILLRLATSPQIFKSDERCLITVQYLGPPSKVEYDQEWIEPDGDEIMVMQQHCGGENLIVFRSCVRKKGLFKFESRRHADFPLGLAFYINNIIVNRLSLCCEARCGVNKRIGGPSGAFLIIKMEKAKPCRQCRFKERIRILDEKEKRRHNTHPDSDPHRPSPPPPPPPPSHPDPPTDSPYSSPPSPRHSTSSSETPPRKPPSPKPHKKVPPSDTVGGTRPGSAENDDPRDLSTDKHKNSNHANKNNGDKNNDVLSNPSHGPTGTNLHRPASPLIDNDRSFPQQSSSPPIVSSKKPKNETIFQERSSSDSTNAQVHDPQWNTTISQPTRSTPSPSTRERERERRTSMDHHLSPLPSPNQSKSPTANQNQTDTLPSPIPRLRETLTNQNRSPKSSAQNNYDEDFIASTAEDETEDDVPEEELRNIRETSDDDPSIATVDSRE